MSNIDQSITTSSIENSHNIHYEPFYLSAEFWVGVSFVLVILAIYKPLLSAIKKLINNRIERIKKEFQDAENLKLDAQNTYANYERKLLGVDEEIEKIVSKENSAIEESKKQRLKELDTFLKQKQNEVDAKIELAYERASKEIHTLITDKSMNILYRVLKDKLTAKDQTNLIDKSISNIGKIDFNLEGKQ